MPETTPEGAIPSVSERVQAELFAARTVLLFGEIDAKRARVVTAELLSLAALGAAPIRLVVNSPGGHVEAADTIHDVVRFIQAPVTMLGTGWVASAAALVYVAVPRERRLALPNTRFLLHQPLGGTSGPASDVEIEMVQILAIRRRLNAIFSAATGHAAEKIAADTERNLWMTAEEAVKYGLAGGVVERDERQ